MFKKNDLGYINSNGNKYYVGDVFSYRNQTMKDLLCFGSYDNGEIYENSIKGMGFYLLSFFHKYEMLNWEAHIGNVMDIDLTEDLTLETDSQIIKDVHKAYDRLDIKNNIIFRGE